MAVSAAAIMVVSCDAAHSASRLADSGETAITVRCLRGLPVGGRPRPRLVSVLATSGDVVVMACTAVAAARAGAV